MVVPDGWRNWGEDGRYFINTDATAFVRVTGAEDPVPGRFLAVDLRNYRVYSTPYGVPALRDAVDAASRGVYWRPARPDGIR